MGLFDFANKIKKPAPATWETLPDDVGALVELWNAYSDYKTGDDASAMLCCEKLLTLPRVPEYDFKLYLAFRNLVWYYQSDWICPNPEPEKVREAFQAAAKYMIAADHPRWGSSYEIFKELFCSPLCSGPDMYESILRGMAEGLGICIAEHKHEKETLMYFEVLRGLIHLNECGMKYAVGKEAIVEFLNALQEPEDSIWKGWPTSWNEMKPDEMRPYINGDNSFFIYNYMVTLMNAGVIPKGTWRYSFPKAVWEKEFPDLPAYEEQIKLLLQNFYDKYGSMNAQELLDSLYADEAAWQAAHSAEVKAAEAAEEERIARMERLYRDGLLYCGLGEEEAGLAAMEESAELGNQRAVLWLLKKAAHDGNAEAYCTLGDLSLQGAYGMVQDELAAYGYYLAACRGSGRANAALSEFYRKGKAGLEADEAMADGFFAVSVELGYAPSCLKQANLAMITEDWEKAEAALNRLAIKTGEDEQDEVFAALAALADLYQRKGDSQKALEYAIRFADLDYAQDPEDKGWQQYRSGVLNGEEKATYEMYRFYCLYHSSGPAKRNEDSLAAPYIRGVGLAFSAVYCDLLRARHKAGDYENTVALLFTQLLETGHEEEALQWADRGIKAYNSHMCYLAATLYADVFYLDDEDKIEYLRRGSLGTSEYSQICKDTLEGVKTAQREAWKEERKAERARIAQAEAQRQKAIDAEMDAFRSRMDMIERDIDLALTGSGYTIEERVLKGDISVMDGVRHQIVRELAEERARKKF